MIDVGTVAAAIYAQQILEIKNSEHYKGSEIKTFEQLDEASKKRFINFAQAAIDIMPTNLKIGDCPLCVRRSMMRKRV